MSKERESERRRGMGVKGNGCRVKCRDKRNHATEERKQRAQQVDATRKALAENRPAVSVRQRELE